MAHESLWFCSIYGDYRTCFTDHSLFGFADASSILTNKILKWSLANVDHVICVAHTRLLLSLSSDAFRSLSDLVEKQGKHRPSIRNRSEKRFGDPKRCRLRQIHSSVVSSRHKEKSSTTTTTKRKEKNKQTDDPINSQDCCD